jgi:hypothetical protein
MFSSVAKFSACFFLLLTGCAFSLSPSIAAPRVRLFVSEEGLHRVTGAALRDAGVDLEKIDPATLQLFHGDREVAIRVLGEKNNLALEFYAQARDTNFSPFSVYWLRWDVANGKRMRDAALSPPAGTPKESFQDTIRFARPTLYIPHPGGASWFWQSLTAPITTTIALTLPAAIPAPATLRVNLWSSTEAPTSPNHHLVLFFNNARVAEDKWGGQGARSLQATLPANLVRAGENALRIVAPGDTGAPADIVLLGSIEVTYARRFVAQNDALTFQVGAGTYRVEGFGDDGIDLYDVTDPTELAHVSNATINSRTLSFRSDAASPRRWLAVGANARKSAARVAPMIASDLRASDRRADYIIITHPDFADALKPLVQRREQQGLRVSVVTTQQVYDEFTFGAESPHAIRAFLDHAYRNWARPAPRFVLLVGKASYDALDYTQGPNKNLVPTFLVDTPNLAQAASDDWFVADAATKRPLMAIGRIPAKTPEQVARAINKTLAFESSATADWRRRAVFATDDKEPSFDNMSDELLRKLPANVQAKKIYLSAYKGDVKAARPDIIQAWNQGALLYTYIGHGSIDTWAAGPLFSAENLGEIKNGDRLPILITPTCLDGFFYHPQKDSLTELLLFKNDGGIVAGLVPTGLSLPESQQTLMRALFDELFTTPAPTLGEAILRAKQKTPGESPEILEVIETFGLLGDPALRLGGGR